MRHVLDLIVNDNDNVKKCVDRLHFRTHVKVSKATGAETVCRKTLDADGSYQENVFDGINTEVAESTFSWLHRYAASLKLMAGALHGFFLMWVVLHRNEQFERSHAFDAAKAAHVAANTDKDSDDAQ